jgi:hypothetical protein
MILRCLRCGAWMDLPGKLGDAGSTVRCERPTKPIALHLTGGPPGGVASTRGPCGAEHRLRHGGQAGSYVLELFTPAAPT